jgi:signal transduction histidine kinase
LALEWQIEEFQNRIRCTTELPDVETALDPERSTAVFRILQETLTNVARCANATEANICLQIHGDVLVLTVHDDGRGVSETELANIRSFGILGMRERALMFGGQLTIAGTAGNGTTVTLRMPVVVQ